MENMKSSQQLGTVAYTPTSSILEVRQVKFASNQFLWDTFL